MTPAVREGLYQTGLFLLKLVLSIIAILTVIFIISKFIMRVDLEIWNIAVMVTVMVSGALWLSWLAFLRGYYPEGSRRRLVARVAMNVLLIAYMVVFTHTFVYSPEKLALTQDLITADNVDASISLDNVYLLLLLIPIISLIDSFAEYWHSHGKID